MVDVLADRAWARRRKRINGSRLGRREINLHPPAPVRPGASQRSRADPGRAPRGVWIEGRTMLLGDILDECLV